MSTVESPAKPYRAGIITGILLMLCSPLGLGVSMYGMNRAFAVLGDNGLASQQQLAHDIGLTLNATAVGLLLFPVGLAVLVASLVLRARACRSEPPPLPAIPAP